MTVTGRDYVAAAAGLVPLLRQNAAETERRGWVADENLAALDAEGILSIGVPQGFGGSIVGQRVICNVLEELARGCGSTAWVTAIYLGMNSIVCAFPEEVQKVVFARGPAKVSGAVTVGGPIVTAEGGYRVSGQWAFHTGCPAAEWSMLLAKPEEGAAPVFALVPMAELEILDDWDVYGMAGTGSNSVRGTDVFVPQPWVLPVTAVPADLQISSLPVLIGMARGAIELFVESLLPGKGISFSRYADKRGTWITHLQTGEAQLRVDTAQLILRELADLVQERIETGAKFSPAEQVRLRAFKAHIARLSREAVELIHTQGGASSIYHHLPIQRIFRDIEAISLHGLNNMPLMASEYGRLIVGHED